MRVKGVLTTGDMAGSLELLWLLTMLMVVLLFPSPLNLIFPILMILWIRWAGLNGENIPFVINGLLRKTGWVWLLSIWTEMLNSGFWNWRETGQTLSGSNLNTIVICILALLFAATSWGHFSRSIISVLWKIINGSLIVGGVFRSLSPDQEVQIFLSGLQD